ncbi:MAG: 2-oxoacid:ferredoxin oxidoreductase subunit beta [Anaerolineae bacterium]
MLSPKDFTGPVSPTWCPGCGDYGILNAVKSALAELDIHPHETFFVSGIGCGSKLPDYMVANGYLGIHGRTLPIAMGAKLANQDLHVIVTTGDGDGYGIGGNHFIHTLRRNPDITFIVQNNMVYALTKGQYAPSSQRGFVTSTSPEGAIETAFNGLALALAGEGTFIARGFSGDPKHLAQVIARAIQHKGFALVDVLQPCVIFNRVNTYDFYKDRVYKVEEEEGYDPTDRTSAWEKVWEWGDRIPIGVIYQAEGVPTYEDRVPALQEGGPLARRPLEELVKEDVEALKEEFI